MRVLYGVQATGNGHISRARVLAPALKAAGIQVDYVFSGRDKSKLFNMEPFGDYRVFRGVTFVQKQGRVQLLSTIAQNNLLKCALDAFRLDVSDYDLVISDFEPISAWAAKRQGVPSVGIAHQYAMVFPIPGNHASWLMAKLIRLMTPVQTEIGLHWHHFGHPVLPPMIQASSYSSSVEPNKILVYLPIEDPKVLVTRFQQFKEHLFYVYTDIDQPMRLRNVCLMPFSREGFQRDLASCAGVVTNCGFGLISESFSLGKKVFSIPAVGQVEQQSNAKALEHLGMAEVAYGFNESAFNDWLKQPLPDPVQYPDVATELARWLSSGCSEAPSALAQRLWHNITPA